MSSSASIAPFSEGSNSDPFVEYEQIDTTIDTDQARIEEMANIPNYEEQGGGGDGEDKAKDDESGALVKKQRAMRSGIWGSFSKVKDANGMRVNNFHMFSGNERADNNQSTNLRRIFIGPRRSLLACCMIPNTCCLLAELMVSL